MYLWQCWPADGKSQTEDKVPAQSFLGRRKVNFHLQEAPQLLGQPPAKRDLGKADRNVILLVEYWNLDKGM